MFFPTPPVDPYRTGHEKDPKRKKFRKDIAIVLGTLLIAYALYSFFAQKVVNILGMTFCIKTLCPEARDFQVFGHAASEHHLLFILNVLFYLGIGSYFLLSIEEKKVKRRDQEESEISDRSDNSDK